MKQTWKAWVALGALNGLVAVMAGAYAAHWLKACEPVLVAAFKTGVDYQMWHALALFAVAWMAARAEGANATGAEGANATGAETGGGNPWLARAAGLCFALGIVLFSGTLYGFGVTGEVAVRGTAPAGGLLLMAGWLLLALSPIGGRGATR